MRWWQWCWRGSSVVVAVYCCVCLAVFLMSCCGDAGVLVRWCRDVGMVVALFWLLVALRKREK